MITEYRFLDTIAPRVSSTDHLNSIINIASLIFSDKSVGFTYLIAGLYILIKLLEFFIWAIVT